MQILPIPSKRPRQGFTLVEIMVVLVLIGIVSAVMIGEMRGTYEDALLRSSTRELVSVFNLAYGRAVSANMPHRVRFDRATGRYMIERRLHGAAGEYAPAREVSGSEGAIDTRISVEFRQPDDTPSDSSDETEIVSFYPDGTADAREIILRDREGFQLAMRINPITAKVQISGPERTGNP